MKAARDQKHPSEAKKAQRKWLTENWKMFLIKVGQQSQIPLSSGSNQIRTTIPKTSITRSRYVDASEKKISNSRTKIEGLDF